MVPPALDILLMLTPELAPELDFVLGWVKEEKSILPSALARKYSWFSANHISPQ